jgi:hypothetical protein
MRRKATAEEFAIELLKGKTAWATPFSGHWQLAWRYGANDGLEVRESIGAWHHYRPITTSGNVPQLACVFTFTDCEIEVEEEAKAVEKSRRLSNGYELREFAADYRAAIWKNGIRYAQRIGPDDGSSWSLNQMSLSTAREVLAAIEEANIPPARHLPKLPDYCYWEPDGSVRIGPRLIAKYVQPVESEAEKVCYLAQIERFDTRPKT